MDQQQDHDILIEIRTIVKSNQEQFIKHCEEDAAQMSVLNKSLSSVHRRVDWLLISGVLAIVLVLITGFLTRR